MEKGKSLECLQPEIKNLQNFKERNKTHPFLGRQKRDYRRRAWATDTGGKGVEAEQGRRRLAEQRHDVANGMDVLGPGWYRAVRDPAVQGLAHRC